MSRQPAHPAIISEDIDRLLGRVLGGTAAVLFTVMVVVQLWRWIVVR